MDQQILKETVQYVLEHTPSKPFLCLPMSAMLYVILKDNHNLEAKLATGDLMYKGNIIFKQDFSIQAAKDNTFQQWAGHAWVEAEGMIIDLSLFRTLYSEQFTKPFKFELVQKFGEGRGCLIGSSSIMQSFGLSYNAVEYLGDEWATGILKGMDELLRM